MLSTTTHPAELVHKFMITPFVREILFQKANKSFPFERKSKSMKDGSQAFPLRFFASWVEITGN